MPTHFDLQIKIAIIVWIYFTLLFLAALWRKDNSIVDIAWGPGFILASSVLVIYSETAGWRLWLVFTLFLIWGSRLALHIFIRNRGKGEDFRYANWRRDWGRSWLWRSYLQVFMLQGLILFLLFLPFTLLAGAEDARLGVSGMLAIFIWLTGFIFESVADYQLLRFKQNPENKGRIMQSGLWSVSRHPNYFGEAVMWWGFAVLLLPVDLGWTGLFAALLMNWLLLRISGVPLLEQKYAGNAEFTAYGQRTPAFFPRLPFFTTDGKN
jgi:steroid 5-alpha reductase family enzyme